MKKTILFDIDYTLIDTDKLKYLIEKENRQALKLKKNEYLFLLNKYASTLKTSIEFSPKRLVDFIENELGRKLPRQKLMNNYFENTGPFQKSLYPETVATLKRLERHHLLGIFSEGVKEFQMAKIRLSGLMKFLDKNLIFIYTDKKKKGKFLVSRLGSFLLVDNDLDHIKDLSRIHEITPILIKRGPKFLGIKELKITSIYSLGELKNYL